MFRLARPMKNLFHLRQCVLKRVTHNFQSKQTRNFSNALVPLPPPREPAKISASTNLGITAMTSGLSSSMALLFGNSFEIPELLVFPWAGSILTAFYFDHKMKKMDVNTKEGKEIYSDHSIGKAGALGVFLTPAALGLALIPFPTSGAILSGGIVTTGILASLSKKLRNNHHEFVEKHKNKVLLIGSIATLVRIPSIPLMMFNYDIGFPLFVCTTPVSIILYTWDLATYGKNKEGEENDDNEYKLINKQYDRYLSFLIETSVLYGVLAHYCVGFYTLVP